jgi:hypothetical protein
LVQCDGKKIAKDALVAPVLGIGRLGHEAEVDPGDPARESLRGKVSLVAGELEGPAGAGDNHRVDAGISVRVLDHSGEARPHRDVEGRSCAPAG